MWENNSDQFPYLVPLIWQGDGVNTSPGYAIRKGLLSPGSGLPTVIWGGDLIIIGSYGDGNFAQFRSRYNTVSARPSPIELEISYMLKNNELNATVIASVVSYLPESNYKILFILTNHFPAQTGAHGADYYYSVVRYQEKNFGLTEIGDVETIAQTITLSPAWDINNLNLVVIIQDLANNKQVIQAGMTNLLTPIPYSANIVAPDDNALQVPLDQVLQWLPGDQYGLEYSLYFGKTNPPTGYYYLSSNTSWTPTIPLEVNTKYFWQIVTHGEIYDSVDDPVWSFTTTDGVSDFDPLFFPNNTVLKGNYPNPFNPSTTIAFELASNGFVTLEIFNVKGQIIKTLVNDYRSAGYYTIHWDGIGDTKKEVGSGIYLYRLQFGDWTETKQMILIK